MIKEAISRLFFKKNLSKTEAYDSMKDIMTGVALPSQIGAFLTGLALKGETVDEIAGCALAMRDASLPLQIRATHLVDTCGTGGDGKGGLNISTAAAFIVAGAGFTVVKHGNRAISSQAGSADVLEVLGVRIDCVPAAMEDAINNAGIGFLFAPVYHPAMKHAMPVRRDLGVRTVFNILGPLTNPARTKVQLIGVFEPRLVHLIGSVMKEMNFLGGLVVHAKGWDEIILHGETHVRELSSHRLVSRKWSSEDFGLKAVSARHLVGGNAVHNAETIQSVLEGKDVPARDVVLANAAAAIWMAEKVYGNKPITLKHAVQKARASIDSGEALKKLKLLAEISHSLN